MGEKPVALLLFSDRCKGHRGVLCTAARNFSSFQLAQRISDKVINLKKKNLNVNFAYIASPKSEVSFISNASKQLGDIMVG